MKTIYPYICILLAPLLTGCESLKEDTFTGRLWSDSIHRNYHMPAEYPGARAYLKADQKDVLVTYTEQQERNDRNKQRAFYVLENSRLLEARRKPHFVSVKSTAGLTEVPILWQTNNFGTNVPSTVLVFSTNQFNFRMVLTNQHQGEFVLPAYAYKHGRETQVLLTPLAVTGDASVVAAVAGYLFLWALASSGASATL